MAFEKEKKINNIVMVIGAAAAVAGLAVLFAVSLVAGILILMVGTALLVISFSVSNVFYKIKMIELLENRKKTN